MRRLATIIALISLLVSCSEKQEEALFTLNGNTGMPKATVYLYGLDSSYERTDSAVCNENGEFAFELKLDSLTPLGLVIPDGKFVPVYADPQGKAMLVKDTAMQCGWSINGGATQAKHDSISRILDACRTNNEMMTKLDSFFIANPVSIINVELVRRYMADNPLVYNKDIRSRISKFGGLLQDHEYIVHLKTITDTKNSNVLHRAFPSFEYTTLAGEKINSSSFLKKYTLVTFWATWDKGSKNRMLELESIKDSIESKSFAMLNISLDYDTAAWKKFVTGDSIPGDHVNDKMTMNSDLVQKFNIKSLPHTMLVSPYQRIIEYDADMAKVTLRADSLTRKYDDEQEKKRKAEEKKNRKKK